MTEPKPKTKETVLEDGARLLEAREVIGWSRRELARRLKTMESNIRKIEKGERAIRSESLDAVLSVAQAVESIPVPPITDRTATQTRKRR